MVSIKKITKACFVNIIIFIPFFFMNETYANINDVSLNEEERVSFNEDNSSSNVVSMRQASMTWDYYYKPQVIIEGKDSYTIKIKPYITNMARGSKLEFQIWYEDLRVERTVLVANAYAGQKYNSEIIKSAKGKAKQAIIQYHKGTSNDVDNNIRIDIGGSGGIPIIPSSPPTIDAKDRIIELGEKFNPMEGVSAKDIEGKSITPVVESSNVNIEIPGSYQIKYKATDSYGLTAYKEVKVTVNEGSLSGSIVPNIYDIDSSSSIDGIFDGFIRSVEVIVNKDTIFSGKIADVGQYSGNFSVPIEKGKIKKATDEVYIRAFDIRGNELDIKPVEIIGGGELTLKSFPEVIDFGVLPISSKNAVYPVIDLDKPLVVSDTKVDKTLWKMKLKIVTPLTGKRSSKIIDGFKYIKNNGEQIRLNNTESIIEENINEEDDYSISSKWSLNNGLLLEVKQGEALQDEYSSSLLWILEDTP